jgi:hypothetical protein
LARSLNSLAGLLNDTNRLDEAEPLYRRALASDEKSFGPDHPNVAIRLNNLAVLLRATNRLVEAEPLYPCTVQATGNAFDGRTFRPIKCRHLGNSFHCLGFTTLRGLRHARWVQQNPRGENTKPSCFARSSITSLTH